MEKAGYTGYVTAIFASTMKTNELSSIRTSCSLSHPPGSSHLAEARPATSSNYSRRDITRGESEPMRKLIVLILFNGPPHSLLLCCLEHSQISPEANQSSWRKMRSYVNNSSSSSGR